MPAASSKSHCVCVSWAGRIMRIVCSTFARQSSGAQCISEPVKRRSTIPFDAANLFFLASFCALNGQLMDILCTVTVMPKRLRRVEVAHSPSENRSQRLSKLLYRACNRASNMLSKNEIDAISKSRNGAIRYININPKSHAPTLL